MSCGSSTNPSSVRNQRLETLRLTMKTMPIVSLKTNQLTVKFDSLHKMTRSESTPSELYDDSESMGELPSEEESIFTANSFQEKYELKEKLGEGANGCVYKCMHKQSGKIYAVKKFQIEQQHLVELKKSFINLKELNHPSILKYRALYFDHRNAYLVMQHFSSPNLTECSLLQENELKQIIQELIAAIRYLHDHNICHRDIKPENILYCSRDKKIKIIDFGIAKKTFQRGARRDMLTIIGTHYYLAPEVYIGGGYDERVDLWALGVTVYRLIAGYTPFESEYHSDTIANILKGEVNFDEKIWNKNDNFAKDFVSRFLKPKEERMSLNEAEKHLYLSSVKRSRGRLQRYVSHNMALHEAFHDEIRNKMRHATSKEEGRRHEDGHSEDEEKVLLKSFNLASVSEFDLEDSDDENFHVSPTQSLIVHHKSCYDFADKKHHHKEA